MSHLTNGKVNLLELKEWLRREFLTFFEDCPGKKLIIWDNHVTGPIGLISEYSVLKERGVDKMFDLKQVELLKARDVAGFSHIFFVVRPKLDLIEIIANHVLNIEKDSRSLNPISFHIIFMPRKSLICEKKLQELGVFGTFKDNIKEFFLDLIPLDYDLLSMENSDVYRDCFLFNDNTHLYHIAKSLMSLQSLYGIIPNITGKGKCAKIVADMLIHMRRELSKNQDPQIPPKIDNLILIDRTFDQLTPMMTQLTYEGLIDENFCIKYTQVEIPPDKMQQLNQGETSGTNVVEMKRSIITLNSADNLFSEIRDKNYNGVSSVLSRTAKELQQAYEMRNQLKNASEMRVYVEKTLKTYQIKKASLANHTTITEILKETTEDEQFIDKLKCQQELIRCFEIDKINNSIMSYIAEEEDILKVLRLVCIHCISNNGLKPKLLEQYKRELIRSYGFKYLGLFNNLEKVGLLYTQAPKVFSNISKTMKLIVDDVDEQNPNDISYVYSGYAPLSVRFCEFLTKSNFKFEYNLSFDTIEFLPESGLFFEMYQNIPKELRKRNTSFSSLHSHQSAQTVDKKTTLVYFIGGCTYAEISAFRFLSNLEDTANDYIVATTNIINGSSLLKSLDDVDN